MPGLPGIPDQSISSLQYREIVILCQDDMSIINMFLNTGLYVFLVSTSADEDIAGFFI